MRNTIFEEDRLLTKAAETPRENKPRFDWAEDLGENRFEIPKVRITDGAGVTVISTSLRWLRSLGRHLPT